MSDAVTKTLDEFVPPRLQDRFHADLAIQVPRLRWQLEEEQSKVRALDAEVRSLRKMRRT